MEKEELISIIKKKIFLNGITLKLLDIKLFYTIAVFYLRLIWISKVCE